MKRKILVLIIGLLSVLMMPTAVFGASSSSYTVDKVNITADLRSDGSALITEEWTVTVDDGCQDCFGRDIVIINDNFERISSVTDISVSLDGNTCTEETGDTLKQGTYFYTKSEDAYSVAWYIPEAGTHIFSIRYIQTGAVKLYRNDAYFYFRAVNEGSSLICRNVSITVNTPASCFPEDFEILESGNLAGGKADGSVTFTAANTAGLVKTGVTMPSGLFDASKLTVIVDDNRFEITVTVIAATVLLVGLVYGIYFCLNYKKVLLNRRTKKCKKKPLAEDTEKVINTVFASVSPAVFLKSVLPEVTNESDYFTVTLLDLVKRGYIKASSAGFTASKSSEDDLYKRKLDENEKRVIRLFASGRWKELITSPKVFYDEVCAFNKKVAHLSHISDFTSKGKRLVRCCFELRLSAKRFEFIAPEEISDSFFKNGKYTVGDLLVSLVNEYDLSVSNDNFEKTSTENFRYNMFMFRDVYSDGEKLVLEMKEAKKRNKKR